MPKYDLPLNDMLKQEGLSVTGVDDNNQPIIVDEKGQSYQLPIDQLLARDGIKKNDVNVIYNDPKEAVDQSPVALTDRARLAFGNVKGSINYLKDKFDDVQYNEDAGGLVVQKGGVWHKVDPTLLGKGDAWQKTKELISDGADMLPMGLNAAGVTVGGGAGSIVGPAGTVLGAAGGGAWAGAMRTSLGRALGTYEATPEEELQDVGMEAIFSAGGQMIEAGVKPSLDMLAKAASNIGKWGTDTTKAVFAKVAGNLAKIDNAAMQTMFADATAVTSKIKGATSSLGEGASENVLIDHFGKQKINIMERMLDEGSAELPRRFGQIVDDLATQADGNLSVNLKDIVKNVKESVVQNGIGTFVKKEGGSLTDLPPGTPEDQIESLLAKPAKEIFKFFSPKKVGQKAAEGEAADLISDPETRRSITNLLSMLDGFGKAGKMEGSAAVKALTQFETNLNKSTETIFNGSDQNAKRLIAGIKSSWKNSLTDVFEGAGLGEQYAAKAKIYAQYGESVRASRALLKQDVGKGIEQLANQFVGTAGKNLQAKDMVGDLVNLLGPRGQAMYKDFLTTHAAQQFSRTGPQLGWLRGMSVASAAGYATGAGVTMATTLPIAGAVISQSVPSLIGKEIRGAQAVSKGASEVASHVLPYARQASDWLKSLPPEQLKNFMSSDDAMRGFVGILSGAAAQQVQLRNQLVDKAVGSGAPIPPVKRNGGF